MSDKKGAPTPKRPRKRPRRRSLPHREKAQRFIIAACTIAFCMTLITGLLVTLQGTGEPPSPQPSTAAARPTPSPEVDPQIGLRLQAAAVAAYLATAIEEGNSDVTTSSITLPARLANGQQPPQVTTPVSFRITKAKGQLIVCARAAAPGSGVPDQFFAFPNEYEADRARRCPTATPTTVPAVTASPPSPATPSPRG